MLKSRFLLYLTPLGVYLLWLLVRLLLRRKPSRFEVGVGLSLLLLVYFLATVGTGIFWVAAQELPVFDWHYLPGYLLLLVGLAHVVLHWRSVAAFLRKRAPEAALAEGGARFTGWVRGVGFTLLGLALGAAVFMAGTRFASQRFSFAEGATDSSGLTSRSIEEGAPLEPRRLKAAPVLVTLAQLYHDGCSYPNRFNLPGLTLRERPPVYLDFPGAATPLPAPPALDGTTVPEVYRGWLAGIGQVAASLNLEQVSALLHYSQGISKTLQRRGGSFDLRMAPSAGALYPVNLYLAARKVEGLAPGLYYYDPRKTSLVLVQTGDPGEALAAVSGSPEQIRSAPATLVYTTTFGRTAFKYKERSYRYVTMDTGHAAYHAALCAAALGLRAPMVARFDDAGLAKALGVVPGVEAPMLLQPLGCGAEVPNQEPRFLPAGMEGAGKGSFLDLIHGGTSLKIGKTVGPRRTFPDFGNPGKNRIALPAPATGMPLGQAIPARRSVRTYSGKPMELAELAALCASSAGKGEGGFALDPLLSGSAPLELTVLVRDVKTLAPGLYRYHAKTRELELVRTGDFAQACMKACLEQEFCGTANAVFFKTIDWDSLAYPDGDRGYRYACLRAGFVGGGLYLQATALGLGACGVGAFEDGAVAQILGLDPAKEVCLYITAVGKL